MTNLSIHQIPLKPALSDRIQPTGFPDLGAATFRSPQGDGTWMEALHVESPQSMAKRLQLTTWDEATQDQPEVLDGLPYVQVVNEDGEYLTSSRVEAHRLASAYIMDATQGGTPGREKLRDAFGLVKDRPWNLQHFARQVLALDPLSLIHGVFFAQKSWARQPKVQRAVTCFIDAHDVAQAVSGGVKTDVVSSSSKDEAGRSSAEGYGSVPHQRTEYTAQRIAAYLSIDHAQLRSFGLGEAGTELLEALIIYELAHLFGDGGLRLRTACQLLVDNSDGGMEWLPSAEQADQRVAVAIAGAQDLLGEVQTYSWKSKAK